MSVVGYPTPGKEKARVILNAFCAGAGGKVVTEIPEKLLPGPAAFYGVTPSTRHLFEQAKKEGRDWYYLDNAYFDSCRQVYFRATKNRLQHNGEGISNGRRFYSLRLAIAPWRKRGEHVLVCPQSDEFMRVAAGYPTCWWENYIGVLKNFTGREIRLRPWQRDKAEWYRTLPSDLDNCWAVVTFSSASAISAMLAGIPAFVTAEDCISAPVANLDIERIEVPEYSDHRQRWCEVVADNQWTLDEMRAGLAWKMLHVKHGERAVA